MAITLADLLDSPDHYLHSLDGELATFVPMSRAAYHRSIFLDGRISPEGQGSLRVPMEMLAGHAGAPRRTAWMFHVAHCGSTLLARALDTVATNLVLREPLALRQAALTSDPERIALVATLVSKRYHADLLTVVKANVPVNFVLRHLLGRDPDAPVLFLYLHLHDYLAAVLRSEEHRGWLRRVTGQLVAHLGDCEGLGDGERAAALWLGQIRAYTAALAWLPGGRALDAEVFFADPGVVLAATCLHMGIPLDDDAVQAVVDGPLFATYSKNPGVVFDNAARLERRRGLSGSLAGDIAAGEAWIARQAPDAEDMLDTLRSAALVG